MGDKAFCKSECKDGSSVFWLSSHLLNSKENLGLLNVEVKIVVLFGVHKSCFLSDMLDAAVSSDVSFAFLDDVAIY